MQSVVPFFHAIGVLVVLLNVLTFMALRRRLLIAFPAHGRRVVPFAALAAVILLHPSLLMAVAGFSGLRAIREYIPDWAAITAMAIQLGFWFYGGFILIAGMPGAMVGGFCRLRRLVARKIDITRSQQPEPINEDRRRLLARAALSVPAAIIATALGGAVASRQLPVIRRLRLPVSRDLTQLHGLTLAQVSDVHVGSYMERDRLNAIREAMNAIGADYHVVTGDLLDNDIEQMELSQEFLRGLRPRVGKFMCMGNHEYIAARSADTPTILRGLRETGVDLLIDESRKLTHGGAHLWLMGIDYPAQMTLERATRRSTDESLDAALADVRDDGAPRILLSHHPKTFLRVRERPVDLTLSGHTHGGQIVAGRIGDYSLSPVLPFELYHNGFYEHNGRKLYVNSGAGGWMPVRINCPPEITLVELVSA